MGIAIRFAYTSLMANMLLVMALRANSEPAVTTPPAFSSVEASRAAPFTSNDNAIMSGQIADMESFIVALNQNAERAFLKYEGASTQADKSRWAKAFAGEMVMIKSLVEELSTLKQRLKDAGTPSGSDDKAILQSQIAVLQSFVEAMNRNADRAFLKYEEATTLAERQRSYAAFSDEMQALQLLVKETAECRRRLRETEQRTAERTSLQTQEGRLSSQ